MKGHGLEATNAEWGESIVVRQAAELALDSGTTPVKALPSTDMPGSDPGMSTKDTGV
jgi:hypothetical protein